MYQDAKDKLFNEIEAFKQDLSHHIKTCVYIMYVCMYVYKCVCVCVYACGYKCIPTR